MLTTNGRVNFGRYQGLEFDLIRRHAAPYYPIGFLRDLSNSVETISGTVYVKLKQDLRDYLNRNGLSDTPTTRYLSYSNETYRIIFVTPPVTTATGTDTYTSAYDDVANTVSSGTTYRRAEMSLDYETGESNTTRWEKYKAFIESKKPEPIDHYADEDWV